MVQRMVSTVAVLVLIVPAALAAGVAKEHLDEYGRGIIEDYSDMEKGKTLEWEWIQPGFKLGDYSVDVGQFENLSKVNDSGMLDTLEEGLTNAFERAAKRGGKNGTLTTENAVYWAERGSSAKRWIPYAGGHLAQAGIGIEMIFRDAEGNIVAKVRHSGREGTQPSDAAWELVDEVASFIQSN